MPRLIEAAYLIECTYKSTLPEIKRVLSQIPDWKVLTEYSGLTNHDADNESSFTSNSTGLTGYLGRAYTNSISKEIMIVHRGTKLNQTYRGCTDDLINDEYLATKSLPPYAELALQFSRDCLTLCETEYSDYQFYQIGHSLGGVLAHICGAQLKLRVIAIDPPGCETIIKELNMADLEDQLKRHHTFLVPRNLTNAVDNHVGCLHYLGEESRARDQSLFKSTLNTTHHKMRAIIKRIEAGQCTHFDPFSIEEFHFSEINEVKSRCTIL